MSNYGVTIERGRVISDKGRVESLTRPGLVTPELKAVEGFTFQTGMYVYYFMFADGSGLILGEVV